MSDELDVMSFKKIEIEAAKIKNFPYEKFLQKAQEYKAKYVGLVITEDNIEECTNLKIQSNKIIDKIDEERKAIKKALTQDITEFEEKCKVLTSCFRDVKYALDSQLNVFEDKRKQERLSNCYQMAEKLLEESGLTKDYITNLIFPESFTNKTNSLKKIDAELRAQVEKLIIEINLKKQQESNRKMLIDNLNLTYKEFGIEFSTENFPLERFNDDQVKEFYECSHKKQIEAAAAKKKKEDERIAAQELAEKVEKEKNAQKEALIEVNDKSESYGEGDIVVVNGIHYQSLIDGNRTNPETSPSSWVKIMEVKPIPNTLPEVGINPDLQPASVYQELDKRTMYLLMTEDQGQNYHEGKTRNFFISIDRNNEKHLEFINKISDFAKKLGVCFEEFKPKHKE